MTDDLPGMWEPADLIGGETDTQDERARLAAEFIEFHTVPAEAGAQAAARYYAELLPRLVPDSPEAAWFRERLRELTATQDEQCGVDFQCHCFDPKAWRVAAEEGRDHR